MPGSVSADDLSPLLAHPDPEVRAAASVALAVHQPAVASRAVPAQLASEVRDMRTLYQGWVQRGKPALTEAEKARIALYYRCQMKEVLALSMIDSTDATKALEGEAFRPGKDFSRMNGALAAFELWDRIDADPEPAIRALASPDPFVADNAEWALIHGGAKVLAAVRQALASPDPATRRRAIRVAAWSGDRDALPILKKMRPEKDNEDLLPWAIRKIQIQGP